MDVVKSTSVNSKAEELFVELFCDAFGPDKANNLYVQYPFVDIYGYRRYIDFALENQDMKIAIEIDGKHITTLRKFQTQNIMMTF